jgi:hypothetical protein
VLSNNVRIRQTLRHLIKRGVIADEDGWDGWLGRHKAVVKNMALEKLSRDQQRKAEWSWDRGRE